MGDWLPTTTQVARKKHECNASIWVKEYLQESGPGQVPLTFAERRLVVQMVRWQKCMILPGQSYIKHTYVDDDGFQTIPSNQAMHELAKKYKMYPDDDD